MVVLTVVLVALLVDKIVEAFDDCTPVGLVEASDDYTLVEAFDDYMLVEASDDYMVVALVIVDNRKVSFVEVVLGNFPCVVDMVVALAFDCSRMVNKVYQTFHLVLQEKMAFDLGEDKTY